MKTIQFFGLSVGASVVLGLLGNADAAERLQRVVQRIAATEGQAATNAGKTLRVAGTTVDAEGKPVAGVVVECYQQSGASGAPFVRNELVAKQRVTTGTDGSFEFQISRGPNLVLATKVGLAAAWRYYWNPTKDLAEERLVLTPPTTIAGVVVDEKDKPVGDAEVWVSLAYSERTLDGNTRSYDTLHGKPARESFSTRTTAKGKFVIQGFPTNAAADLAVSAPGKVLREPPREYIGPDSLRCQAGQQDVKLVVEPAGSVEGKVVVQGTGEPLAGVRLWLQGNRPGNFDGGEREPAQSGTDGTFRLTEVAAGTYQVHARYGTNPIPEWVAEVVSVEAQAGQTVRDVKVSATKGGFLQVAVLGKDDHKPITDVSINAFKDTYQAGASSGPDGIALLRLPAGEYRVSAYKENSRFEGTAATVENGQTNHLEIELNPPPKITGVVRDPAGAPVPGLELSIFPNWGQNSAGAKTDVKGRYEMLWNPQRFGPSGGGFCLLARDLARNLAIAQDIEEGTTTLDLRLEPGLVVAGRVEDGNGRPLTNATVQVHLMAGNTGSQFDEKPIHADAQGRFEISTLPPGRHYLLWVNAKGYGSANLNINESGDTNRVELEPCVLKVADRKLAGEVVDAEEKPAARVSVYLYGQGQPNGSVRTDEKGRFKFEEVCEGSVQLSANSRGAYGNARAEAGDTNVVIHLGANQAYSVREVPRRPSLKGKPLPDLAAVELGGDAAPAGKPVLLCLFDVDQRPSRRFVKHLAEQQEALRQKGLTVLGLQAAVTTSDSFKEWKEANPVPFPVGRLSERADATKWASDVESFPWLILADGEHRVTAEGFDLDELAAKLKGMDQ